MTNRLKIYAVGKRCLDIALDGSDDAVERVCRKIGRRNSRTVLADFAAQNIAWTRTASEGQLNAAVALLEDA